MHFIVFALCGLISWTAVACVLWIMVSFNRCGWRSALYLSLRCKKVTFAVIVNLLVPIAIYAVVPLLGAILGQIVGGPYSERYAEAVCYYLPYFYLGSAVESLRPSGFRDVWMPSAPSNTTIIRRRFSDRLLMVWSLVYLGVAAAILAYTTRDLTASSAEPSKPNRCAARVPPVGPRPQLIRAFLQGEDPATRQKLVRSGKVAVQSCVISCAGLRFRKKSAGVRTTGR